MSEKFLFSGSPFRAAEGLANAVVQKHAPGFLQRGGALGRAASEVRKGASAARAAEIAASTGKGHIAELRLATDFTLTAALGDSPFLARPNAVANHPHADLEVVKQGRVFETIQVGVGSAAYLRKKSANSLAGQVVIPTEIREQFCANGEPACARTSDAVSYGGVQSKPLSADDSTAEAIDALLSGLQGHPRISEWVKVGLSADAGCAAAADGFATGLLFEAVERLVQGKRFDSTMVDAALSGAARAGLRTALQTYISVDEFLAVGSHAFNARVVRRVGQGVVWAGAIAEVVVSTAVEIVAWLRNEIDFDELLKRAGVHVATAAGGALATAGALYLLRGAPPAVQVIGVIAAAYFGSKVGREFGNDFFTPRWSPTAPAATPRYV